MARNLTVSALLGMDACTAQCLTAAGREATGCKCQCRGVHHGKVAGFRVPGSAGAVPPSAPVVVDDGQLALDFDAGAHPHQQ